MLCSKEFQSAAATCESVIAGRAGGYMFTHGEPAAKKNLVGVAAGTGIAVLAKNILS